MFKNGSVGSRSTLVALLVCGAASAALAADLSQYRDFHFGADLPAVAKQAGVDPSQAKAIHSRPALIQELAWRPEPLGSSSQAESVQQAVFSFYNGQMFRIAVDYDRSETEGLTDNDFIEAISASYGVAEKPAAPPKAGRGDYGDPDTTVARWQDSQYCFDLIRASYGPRFRLVGYSKGPQALAQAATIEANRLDVQEAPQRDAARIAGEKEAELAKLATSRLVNKPKFRP